MASKLKKKRLTFSLSKTVQVKDYEPIKFYAEASGDLPKGLSVAEGFKELQEDCEKQIDSYFKSTQKVKKKKKRKK